MPAASTICIGLLCLGRCYAVIARQLVIQLDNIAKALFYSGIACDLLRNRRTAQISDRAVPYGDIGLVAVPLIGHVIPYAAVVCLAYDVVVVPIACPELLRQLHLDGILAAPHIAIYLELTALCIVVHAYLVPVVGHGLLVKFDNDILMLVKRIRQYDIGCIRREIVMLIHGLNQHIDRANMRVDVPVLVDCRLKKRHGIVPVRRYARLDYIPDVMNRQSIPVEIEL